MAWKKCNAISEACRECKDKVCGKSPIIETILTSGDARKIKNLVAVLTAFDYTLEEYR